MSDYDNGFARAQRMYEAQEPPDHSQDMCRCGFVLEEHQNIILEGKDYEACPQGFDQISILLAAWTFTEIEHPEED